MKPLCCITVSLQQNIWNTQYLDSRRSYSMLEISDLAELAFRLVLHLNRNKIAKQFCVYY